MKAGNEEEKEGEELCVRTRRMKMKTSRTGSEEEKENRDNYC